MNVLVTGGAGYIGGAVSAHLIRVGHVVTVLDNLSTGNRRAAPAAVRFVEGDISDALLLDEVFGKERIDAVMHFAASAEVGESMLSPQKYFRNNTVGSLTLLEAMVRHGVQRIVFSSSAAVYGEPLQLPIGEDHPRCPTNPYGESKLQVERILHWFHLVHGLRYATLRYFNAAGAMRDHGEDHEPESHLIPLVLAVAAGRRDAITVFGTDCPTPDGTCIRDYVHISDLADAHLRAMDALQSAGELVYNLGNGTGFSVLQVLEVARRITGHPIPALFAGRRAGDPAALVAGCSKIQQQLQWRPRFAALTDIIASAWEWHSEHPQGYGA